MMKVIFLDFDGVLNVIGDEHDEYSDIFHQHLVDNLGRLIEKTGAKLVITSSWRSNGIVALREMWAHRNYPGEIIDITQKPVYITRENGFYYKKYIRGQEIDFWLKDHPEVTDYCIIDDDSDMLEEQLPFLIFTQGNSDHTDHVEGYGLTTELTDKAIEILNKQENMNLIKRWIIKSNEWYDNQPDLRRLAYFLGFIILAFSLDLFCIFKLNWSVKIPGLPVLFIVFLAWRISCVFFNWHDWYKENIRK